MASTALIRGSSPGATTTRAPGAAQRPGTGRGREERAERKKREGESPQQLQSPSHEEYACHHGWYATPWGRTANTTGALEQPQSKQDLGLRLFSPCCGCRTRHPCQELISCPAPLRLRILLRLLNHLRLGPLQKMTNRSQRLRGSVRDPSGDEAIVGGRTAVIRQERTAGTRPGVVRSTGSNRHRVR